MLGVFLFHRGITSAAGIVAVACFFVLGGFCSAIAYADKFSKPDFIYGKYVVNRLIKYYPIHWLFLLVSLICADFEIIRFFLNASLLQSWVPKMSVYFSFNGVSWYLSDIVFFVLICPFLLRFLSPMKVKKLIMVLAFICFAYLILAILLPIKYQHQILYIHPIVRLFDFAIGLIGGLLYIKLKDKISFSRFSVVTSFIISMAVLIVMSLYIPKNIQYFSLIYWPFALILFLSLSFSQGRIRCMNNSLLVEMGTLSFAFYMAHKLCIQILGGLLEDTGVLSHAVITVILLVITILVSYVVKTFFEIPITNKLRKISTNWFVPS